MTSSSFEYCVVLLCIGLVLEGIVTNRESIDILSSVHCLGTSSIVVWLFVVMLLVDYTETELKYC